MSQQQTENMLAPYRVLDLTSNEELLCGKLLGDLGADVIKIERPGGDAARNTGPFYHDETDPEKSLFWFAFNTSKRGITLNIETADGREIFKKLVKGADFIIESFPPGYLDKLGLGYEALERLNPGVILVSITPFGQSGPYRDYKAPDIVAWAMGGEMYLSGDGDRPPVRVSHHSQAHMHAAVEAAIGAMSALYYRAMTGAGQQVDVSVQECVTRLSHQGSTIPWDTNKTIATRVQGSRVMKVNVKRMWPCKDGYVIFNIAGGIHAKRYNPPIFELMESQGIADDFHRGIDWDTFDLTATTQEIIDRLEEPIGKFFMMHTTAELMELGVKCRIQVYPVATTANIFENVQLAARGYWVELEHPEINATITYPGAFVNASETPLRISRRAPLIGEHNQEIYEYELGFTREELLVLRQAGVI
jgi:benzylsuccinate CoA-transferase BbsE subunit